MKGPGIHGKLKYVPAFHIFIGVLARGRREMLLFDSDDANSCITNKMRRQGRAESCREYRKLVRPCGSVRTQAPHETVRYNTLMFSHPPSSASIKSPFDVRVNHSARENKNARFLFYGKRKKIHVRILLCNRKIPSHRRETANNRKQNDRNTTIYIA